MMKLLIVFLTLAVVAANAATIRLPTRYIITEYKVHTLTGLTSGEVTKERTRDSPLEIMPYAEGDANYIKFKAPRGTGVDRSSEYEALVPMGKRDELIAALKSIVEKRATAKRNTKPADSSELLFDEEDFSITFFTKVVHRSAYADLVVGERQYVLRNDQSIQNLIEIIGSL